MDNNTNKKIKYHSLNTLKGLACIGVIYLHCPFPGEIGKFLSYAFKFAVPIFFMISGYFLYSKDNSQIDQKIKKQAIKILKILLISIAIYGIFDYLCSYLIIHKFDSSAEWIVGSAQPYFSFFVILRKIFIGTFFNNTLWYFHALFFAYLIIGPIIKHVNVKSMIWLVGFLFVFHIVTRVYAKNMDFSWYEANFWRSFLLTALPWMLTGYICAINKEYILNHISKRLLLLLIAAGYLMQVVEYKLYNQSISFYFGTILYCISIFLLCIKKPEYKINNQLNFIGEKLSLYVYIIHYGILVIFNDILPRNTIITDWTIPLIAIILSLLTAFIYHLLEQKINYYKRK